MLTNSIISSHPHTYSPNLNRRKPRLAIVSTFDELCGIAGYTRFLIKQLADDFDIEVFELDQFFMRSFDYNVRKLADKMVKDFCARARDFDVVNLQFEYGTLGPRNEDVVRRFSWIVKAAPALSVTFHTVLQVDSLDHTVLRARFFRGQFNSALNYVREYKRNTTLHRRIVGALRRLQLVKHVSVIVHTRRDMRLMRYANRLKNVYDHPLAFLAPEEVERLRLETTRNHFPILARLPKQTKLIGVFGFLNDYKGFEVPIRALQRLPRTYHLAIFGALHPNEIKARQVINPYVKRLLDEAYVRKTVLDENDKHSVSLSIDSASAHLLFRHPRDVSGRVHFMGAQTDEDFARAMAVCDYAVFPYLEVGQSSSGPISIALEMGVRVIAARTRAFMQFERYHPNCFEMFEIGNDVELAERILSDSPVVCGVQPRKYNSATNRELYVKANSAAVASPERKRIRMVAHRLIASFVSG